MSITNVARSPSRLCLAVTMALCVSAATGAYAADAVPAPADEPAAPEGIAEVIVTSQRREESLSKVPISITAITQQDIDNKGIKDITDIARFTPGISVDTTGTANIAIRGVASSGGSGTTGIYIDDTPIQMRGLAFNPDEALPKAFDMERVEVLRGPQGTLFGAGSEGGTVRYITTQPSLTKTTAYSRNEVSYTTHGDPSFETGVAVGGPVIDGKLGVRATVWYRRDGGWIDRVDPTAPDPQSAVVDRNANHADNVMIRLAALWAVADNWTVTPSVFYQNRNQHDVGNYWPLYSNPSDDRYISGNPTQRPTPDRFYLPALKIQGDFGAFQLISNTSYYHRAETTGYDGTLYNLGFYQTFGVQDGVSFPLLDGNGIHLPDDIRNYRSPASVDNDQQNFTQEIRLQSSDPTAKLLWTGGLFFSSNRQQYLEQIHDPQLEQFSQSVFGAAYLDEFSFEDPIGSGNFTSVPYDPRYPNDSYFLHTHARDKQYAVFGEATYAVTDSLKVTAGVRFSRTEFTFDSETGGPQLFAPNQTSSPGNKENAFTPKLNVSYQIDAGNMVYGTYAKGFRPGGGNNPLPQAACADDFTSFGITKSPDSYSSDSVHSFEVGSKNNVGGRLRLASSLYYIRWNNIQQTVVPPICQISFITNLGKATAWGGDVQVEWSITDALTTELTAGYTNARFDKDSSFGSTSTDSDTPQQPIVRKGNAIVGESGQPGAPVTVSVGAEYKFSLADRQSFVRFDYEYTGRNHWTSPRQDPATAQFDSANYTLSATNFASVRGGMQFDAWSVEPFIDNLFDTHTVTNYDFTIDPGTGDSRLQRQFTFRPRTYGVTATYRY